MRWGQARLAVLVLATAALGWRTLAELVAQHGALPLPAVVVVAPLAALVAVALHRIPLTSKLPSDRETDVIIGLTLLVLGGWLVIRPPSRLGDQFWLWRPDLLGVAICTVAVAALLSGTRFALWAAGPVLVAGIVSAPGAQLVLAGLPQHRGRAGAAAALLAAAPLLVARPIDRRSLAARIACAGGAAVVGAVLAAAFPVAVGTAAAAILGAVAVEAVILRLGVRTGQTANPDRRPGRGSLAWLVAAVALVAGAQAWVPTAHSAVPPSPRLVTAGSDVIGAAHLANGVDVEEWRLDLGLPANRAVVVSSVTGPSPAALLTYPTTVLLKFGAAPCPNRRTVHVGGRKVTVVQYLDWNNGYRWVDFTWAWKTATRAQRVDVVAANGPAGAPVAIPTVAPSPLTDAVRTIGAFVAGRHPQCGLGGTPEDAFLTTITKRLMHQ
jgi:hypothetical protein